MGLSSIDEIGINEMKLKRHFEGQGLSIMRIN
jgi:hypothetical protein